MYNIKTLNSISPVYENILKSDLYNVAADAENPDAILVRSADMHSYDVNPELLCVARAGAGVNNLPWTSWPRWALWLSILPVQTPMP